MTSAHTIASRLDRLFLAHNWKPLVQMKKIEKKAGHDCLCDVETPAVVEIFYIDT